MYDIPTLTKYVGASRVEEAQALLSASSADSLQNVSFKDPKFAMMLAIFTGFFGFDRLYQGGIKMFFVKLSILLFSLGTWYIADIYYTAECVRIDNLKKLSAAASA